MLQYKIEHGNSECVKEATTQYKSRKQTKGHQWVFITAITHAPRGVLKLATKQKCVQVQ